MDDKQRDETIPGAAVEEFEAIRLRGERNMFDRLGVRQLALMNGYDSLAVVASSRNLYAYLLQHYGTLRQQMKGDDGR